MVQFGKSPKQVSRKTSSTIEKKNVKIQQTPPKANKATSYQSQTSTSSTASSNRSSDSTSGGFLHKLTSRFRKPERKKYHKLFEEQIAYNVLTPKLSATLPQLSEKDKDFLELVDIGDVAEVTKFLEANPDVNVNCVNYQGVSALHMAVQNADFSMVEYLSCLKNIDFGDSILVAIRDNKKEILQLLLHNLQNNAPALEFVGTTHSSHFPDHVTPLILAAQCGHYEIIELLIERGHRIAKPHPPDCLCTQCKQRLEHCDLLHSETMRLNLYQAVSNPAYICHSTHDPILAAFLLSKELRQCAFMIRSFRAAYTRLADEISAFAVELIGHCRSTAEVELILRQRSVLEGPTSFAYPRLLLAMDCQQNEFVAHPNTQQIVEAIWIGDWYDWKVKPMYLKLAYPLYRIMMLPFMAIMCFATPKNTWVRHWQVPLNKMISHNCTYAIFLAILFFQSNLDKTDQKRGAPDSGAEIPIIVYVFGYIFSSIRMCAIRGPTRYFSSLWGWHDLINDTLFVVTFIFWLIANVDLAKNDQADLERKFWNPLDPTLVAEGTFAIATIMAWLRLLYLCRLNIYLGPLQIALGKMSADVAKYIFIFFIIIVSFTVGLCRFYQYYDGMVQVDETYEIKTEQVSSFVDFASTLKTFFWAVFCMAPLESADVIIENLPGPSEGTTVINSHTFTETIGYVAFALFEFLSVIVILNMLIATMSNTFQKVTDNVDVEWTFGKTEFYLEFSHQTTLPPPFNLVPTRMGVSSAIEWFRLLLKKKSKSKAGFSLPHCCYIEHETDPNTVKEYTVLMGQLIQRYFKDKASARQSVEAELDEIKRDLAIIRKHV